MFPWVLYRTGPNRPPRKKGEPYRNTASGRGDCLRVSNLHWCMEFAEMWERTGIKPVPENLRDVLARLR